MKLQRQGGTKAPFLIYSPKENKGYFTSVGSVDITMPDTDFIFSIFSDF
jgi:hypothetical protein